MFVFTMSPVFFDGIIDGLCSLFLLNIYNLIKIADLFTVFG